MNPGIQLLQNQMAGVEQDVAARVVIHALEKHLKGDTIVRVLSGMNLEAISTPALSDALRLAAIVW